jgi:hypothetical protein
MFQWLYDLFMAYIMPMLASIMQMLGMGSKDSFESDEKQLQDEPPVEEVEAH